MTEIYPPTRKQFEEFLKNHELIRRFELLFRIVGEDLFDLINQSSDQAQSTANDAISRIESLAQEYRSNIAFLNASMASMETLSQDFQAISAVLEAKANNALDLSEINNNDLLEHEFLMQAVCAH